MTSRMPLVGLKAAAAVAHGARLAVLDTNAVLNVAMSSTAQQQFVRDFGNQVVVVPAIVHAELAGKTHLESYRRQDDSARRTAAAAMASVTLMVPGCHWPSATASTVAFGYPTTAYWSRLGAQRLRPADGRESDWLRWTRDDRGQLHSEPAMADHQVLLTAWGLQQDGYDVTLLTNDRAVRVVAKRLAVQCATVLGK